MSDKKYSKEFDEYWKKHEQQLIMNAPKPLSDERRNTGKMNTAGDWLLFIVPLMAGIGFMNVHLIGNEMVNCIVGLAIVVVCFAIAVMIKPCVTGKRSVVDIDADIKDFFYSVYEKEGIDGLNVKHTSGRS